MRHASLIQSLQLLPLYGRLMCGLVMRGLIMSVVMSGLALQVQAQTPDEFSGASGSELMSAVYARHQQYPYVYEEQSMILIDRQGNKNTRKLRRYSRVNEDGGANFLLLFDSPVEVKGVALLAHRDAEGTESQSFYLPAFSNSLIENNASDASQGEDHFLGTDYSIENLVGEMIDSHQHVRRADETIDEESFYVVDVYNLGSSTRDTPQRRHYIRHDNLFIARTDHFDDLGRIRKQQTQHDLTNVHGDMWRANMMMMNNHNQDHRTIIKIDRRVFSADYVPAEVFSTDWIMNNQPYDPAPVEQPVEEQTP